MLTLSFMAAALEGLLCISGQCAHPNPGNHFSMSCSVKLGWRMLSWYGKCIIIKAGDFVVLIFVCLFGFGFFSLHELQQFSLFSGRGCFFFSWKNQSEFLLCKAKQILHRVTILQCLYWGFCTWAFFVLYLGFPTTQDELSGCCPLVQRQFC